MSNVYGIFAGKWMGWCIEKIAMGISKLTVGCGGDRNVSVDCFIKEIHRGGEYMGSKFNSWMEITEEVNEFLSSSVGISVIPTPSPMYLLYTSGNFPPYVCQTWCYRRPMKKQTQLMSILVPSAAPLFWCLQAIRMWDRCKKWPYIQKEEVTEFCLEEIW